AESYHTTTTRASRARSTETAQSETAQSETTQTEQPRRPRARARAPRLGSEGSERRGRAAAALPHLVQLFLGLLVAQRADEGPDRERHALVLGVRHPGTLLRLLDVGAEAHQPEREADPGEDGLHDRIEVFLAQVVLELGVG